MMLISEIKLIFYSFKIYLINSTARLSCVPHQVNVQWQTINRQYMQQKMVQATNITSIIHVIQRVKNQNPTINLKYIASHFHHNQNFLPPSRNINTKRLPFNWIVKCMSIITLESEQKNIRSLFMYKQHRDWSHLND